MTDEPMMYTVPKGTRPSTCGGDTCKAEVYWIETPSRARKYAKLPEERRPTVRLPIDCAVPGGQEPDSLQDGRGVSHFTTCPDADAF